MDERCRAARAALKAATRREYEATIYNAKLTPAQEEILRRHVLLKQSVSKISLEMGHSNRKTTYELHAAYESICNLRFYCAFIALFYIGLMVK